MIELIKNVVQLAQSIQSQDILLAQTPAIPQHVGAFIQNVAPEAQDDIDATNKFISAYRQAKSSIDTAIAAWRGGSDEARTQALNQLQGLSTFVQSATSANTKVFQDLSSFKQAFNADEEQLGGVLNQINAQISAIQAGIQDQQNTLAQEKATLALISVNPITYWIYEGASLLTTSQTLEQAIVQANTQMNAYAQTYYNLQHASAITQQLSSSVQSLINSSQNLSNSTSIIGGQITQLVDTVTNASATNEEAVVFQAYWATFDGQVNDLDVFINS